jgi:hypothetical protein
MARLVRFFSPIHDLNRRTASGEIDEWDVDLDWEIDRLGLALEEWMRLLPWKAQMTHDNL